MKRVFIGAIFFFVALSRYAHALNPQLSNIQSMDRIVIIRAEDGEVSFQGSTVSMYSSTSLATRTNHEKIWKYVKNGGGGLSITFRNNEWINLSKPLPSENAFPPGMDDWWNQIDIASSNTELKSLMPEARIKNIHEDGNTCIVVYSNSTEQVRYGVEVALLKKVVSGKYVISEKVDLGENGFYSGIIFLKDKRHFVVLIDEPASSSNFLVAHIFALR